MAEQLTVTFLCQHPTCINIAASVDLITSGIAHPDDQFLQRDIMERILPGIVGQISLKGFIQDYRSGRITNYSMPLGSAEYQQVAAALHAHDAAALYMLNREYAPFYCQRCQASFCTLHYQLKEVWDEAGPDFWQGVCPHGHRKFIDH